MDRVYLKARAKINLCLEVLDKLENNYHNIKSVFQKISLYDEMYIEKNSKDGIEIQTDVDNLKLDENIIYVAYLKLKNQYKNISGVKVILKKNIPMQAGLAGGSTDCASFILGMNKLFELNMTKEKIEEIGKSIGADVVPCFYNSAVIAEGIGDKITKIETNFKYYIIVIKPDMTCSTKDMYEKIDKLEEKNIIDKTKEIVCGLQENNVETIAKNLYNKFEKAISEEELLKIKKELLANLSIGTLMTGSGSCIYGIFRKKEDAKKAYNNLKGKYETYLCLAYNSKREEKF